MNARTEIARQSGTAATLAAGRLVWSAARLPLLGILALLEPFVRSLCSLVMVLGVITAFVFEMSAAGPRFPFLWMLGFSLAFGVVLFLYYGLTALLSR